MAAPPRTQHHAPRRMLAWRPCFWHGCQFSALGACPVMPVVPGGCPHPTGWWGHPNHRQLHQEVLGTRDPTTARDIWCLRGVCEARRRSPPRHHCAPAPRSTTPRGRLVRWVLLQAAPGTPGPARRNPNYCDPNLAHRRSVVGPVRPYRLHDGALAKVHMRDK